MSFDVEEHVCYQIANAELRGHPFPHFYVPDVFPADFYQQLRAALPPTEWLAPIGESGSVKIVRDGKVKLAKATAYPSRFIADLATIEEREEKDKGTQFWATLSGWLMSERFRSLLLAKFGAAMSQRFGSGASVSTEIDARLVRDFTRYAIGPHTDNPAKLISLLFYLPADSSMSHLGTCIYSHQDPAFRCDGRRHHDFAGFKKVAGMPYVPNALFAFFKTDHSFHGVDRIDDAAVERDLLLYNIFVRAVRRESRPGFLWPWRRRSAQWVEYKPGPD